MRNFIFITLILSSYISFGGPFANAGKTKYVKIERKQKSKPDISNSSNAGLEKTKNNLKKVVSRIESAILTLNPKLKKDYANKLAIITAINARKYRIDPRLMLSIMNTESSFNQNAVSSTNDVSIAQINLNVWTPSFFKKTTGQSLDVSRLKKDESYAISRMCLILNYYKNEFPNDKAWYARYHSSTPKHKSNYNYKLVKSAKKIKHYGNNLLKEMPTLSEIKVALQYDRSMAAMNKK